MFKVCCKAHGQSAIMINNQLVRLCGSRCVCVCVCACVCACVCVSSHFASLRLYSSACCTGSRIMLGSRLLAAHTDTHTNTHTDTPHEHSEHTHTSGTGCALQCGWLTDEWLIM